MNTKSPKALAEKPLPKKATRVVAAKRKPEPVDRRAQILDVSARLFCEFGFEQTSVRQIADQLNMLPGSLYHHFETKEDILHEIIRKPQQRIVRQDEVLTRLPVNAELRLVATVISRFHQFSSNWEVQVLLTQESNFFRQRQDFAYVQKAKDGASISMQGLLKEGVKDGLFRAGIDPYLLIGTIWTIISSAAGRLRADQFAGARTRKGYSFDDVIDYHLDCILRMVRPASRIDDLIPRKAAEKLVASCIDDV